MSQPPDPVPPPQHDPYQPPQIQPLPPSPDGPKQAASALDAIIPTNPLAAVSCWSGIIGLLLCPLGPILGPIALITGILALNKWKARETQYGATTSKVRAWIGISTGIIGTLAGITVLVMTFLVN